MKQKTPYIITHLREIEAYCREAGIEKSTFGRLAGQGGLYYSNLSDGKQVWPSTVDAVRAYMEANPAKDRPKSRRRKAKA